MKKYFLILFIFSHFYFSFAEDFHHKYTFYKFENETRLQTIITNIFDESNKIIKTVETRIPYNMPIYSSEEIEYEYEDNQLFEITAVQNVYTKGKYSLQGTTQGRYLTGGVPPVRFSM